MSRVSLGNFEITLIRESIHWWDGGAFFGVVPKTLWGKRVESDALNRIPAGFNCYLIQTGEHNILIETGGGDKMDARARERMNWPLDAGDLPAAIARRGFDPEAIDIVINSHLHWDHCSGNTFLSGDAVRPAFARAQYYASRGEWEHAHERHTRDAVSYIDANYDPLVEAGRMTLVDGDFEVAPGVWMRGAPGHNRDLKLITAESAGETFCFLSDMVPMAAHLQPSWVAAFDLFPIQAIETKQRWLGCAADGNWLCGFSHEVTHDFARVTRHPKTGFALA